MRIQLRACSVAGVCCSGILLAGLSVMAAARVSDAQSPARVVAPSTVASIAGVVRDAANSNPIAGAVVQLTSAQSHQTTDALGRFEFAELAEGEYDLEVRRIGFQPTHIHVSLTARTSSELTIALPRLPAVLTEVRVAGRMLKVPARYEEVYRRASLGFGRLITHDDIERANVINVSSLFMAIPGIHVYDRSITFERCRPGPSGPGGSSQSAKVQVYIDGVRVTHYNRDDSRRDPADYDEVQLALKLVHPSAIEAIELYTGVARIPAEFLNDACAVIAIWTKAY